MERGSSTEEWLRGRGPIESGASLADGTEIGRWRIVAFVARGGSGEVYRAEEVNGRRTAALKILHRDNEAAVARFEREAHVLSELRNPIFPAFFGSGEYQGRPWYATEFLQPLDLPKTDGAVARLVRAICRGAGTLHALGYVHRDIKPSNILSRNGDPVLIDLGLLKRAETPALHPGETLSIVDGQHVGVGTPGYAAPEQLVGVEVSPSADVHAIGVLANVCFEGTPPRAWRSIIRRATSSLPSGRYPDVASLAQAVRFRHIPAVAAVAGALAVLAVVAMSDVLFQERQTALRPQLRPMGKTANASKRQTAVLVFSENLGEPLGLSGNGWLTSKNFPWHIDPDIPGAIRSGAGNPNEPDSMLSVPIEGPASVSFRYRRHFAGDVLLSGTDQPRSFFEVTADEKVLFQDFEGDADFRSPLGEERFGRIDVPSGHHRVVFDYVHNGTGYIDQFNGVRLVELRIER